MVIQPIIDIAEICVRHGMTQAVICPGSRNAAITLGFARHPKIDAFVIPDERSAAYVALGLAQSSGKTVAVVSTSGTAAANLYPAIIEAFYQQIPLLILTADRPQEWIDQQDAQAIRQQNIFQNHILDSYQFPVSYEHRDAAWHACRIVNEAIIKTGGIPSGPVHINVPIREPFYPDVGETFQYTQDLQIIGRSNYQRTLPEFQKSRIAEELGSFHRIMLVVGQGHWSEELLKTMEDVQEGFRWVVLGDVIGNIHSLDRAITHHDLILMNESLAKDLSPDLLITIGQGVLSKSLKNFLRKYKPDAHWHIGDQVEFVDTFQCLSDLHAADPGSFMQWLLQHPAAPKLSQMDYFDLWHSNQRRCQDKFSDFCETVTQGEYKAVKDILSLLPNNCVLHLANSMPVRYVNYLGIPKRLNGVEVWSNRGTSGIDGCTSTMIGHAINSKKLHVLLTGDVAFFYDRNGLWHQHVPDNVRIIVLNNHGGGIFRLIDGPRQQPELEEYFESKQVLGVKNTAGDFGFTFYHVGDVAQLSGILPRFFDSAAGKAILEIETDPQINQEVFDSFRSIFRKS